MADGEKAARDERGDLLGWDQGHETVVLAAGCAALWRGVETEGGIGRQARQIDRQLELGSGRQAGQVGGQTVGQVHGGVSAVGGRERARPKRWLGREVVPNEWEAACELLGITPSERLLQDLLGLFAAKKMVLIDTTGLAPRDPRKNDALDVLDLPDVRRLLVLNAGAHGDTLDDVVAAFKSVEAQPTVLSKIDEAVKLGPALDVAIRHQLVLRGVTNGQKVPHDWDAADATELVRSSMRVSGKSAFDPKTTDLGFLFLAPESHGSLAAQATA